MPQASLLARARSVLPRALSWPTLAFIAALPSIQARLAGRSMGYRDTAWLYTPVRGLVTEALREGRLPLWNPYEGMGKPLFAEGLHGVLHPLSLLAAFVDPGGVDLLIALYLVAAAVGAFLLARELGLERPHAFIAGLAYSLSGYVMSMTGNLVFLAGASSLPFQVAALAATGRGARFGLPAAAAATAVTLFSGDAQSAIVATLLGLAFAAERGGWRGAGRAAVATLVGGVAAAIQVLPALAAMELSPRAGGVDPLARELFAFSPWRIPELLLPGFFVRFDDVPVPYVFRWLGGPSAMEYGIPFSPSVYLGIPVLALAASAPFRERRVKVLAGSLVVLLWLALGHVAGATQALSSVPVWGKFRYAEKLVAPLSLAIALLAAFGARGPDGAGPSRRRILVAALSLLSVALVAYAIAWNADWAPGRAQAMLVGNIVDGLPHPILGTIAVLAATWAVRREDRRTAALGGAVAASLLAAIPFARILMPLEPCHAWPGALAAEPPGPRIAVPYVNSTPRRGHLDELPKDGVESMLLDTCALAWLGTAPQSTGDRVDSFWSYGGLGSQRRSLLSRALPSVIAQGSRYFSATHAAVSPPNSAIQEQLGHQAAAGGTLVAQDPDFELELFSIPHAPWARFAPAVEVVPGMMEAVGAFASIVTSGRDVVVVESNHAVPVTRGVVRSVSRLLERVAVEVDAASDGLLVVNDSFWPGWIARVDGREVPILAANVLARGVVVPPGRHVVTMEYAPREVRVGTAISLLGLLACGALAVRDARRRGSRNVACG